MQLAAVQLARFYGLIQAEDLNKSGTVYFPELTNALVERYGFIKYPSKAEDFENSKGIEFEGGRDGKRVITKLSILDNGIYLDTSIDTSASEAIWFEMMGWASDKLGISFDPAMVKRRAYVSQLTFYSDVSVLETNPILSEIGNLLTTEVEANYGQRLEYEPTALAVGYDAQTVKLGTAPFNVQRREGVLFDENKYFSTAPVKTEIHLDILEGLERAMKR